MTSTQDYYTALNDPQSGDMEFLGYSLTDATCPSPGVIRGVMESSNAVEGSIVYARGGKEACDRFLNSGLDSDHDVCRSYSLLHRRMNLPLYQLEKRIKGLLGEWYLYQGPAVIHSISDAISWGRITGHPSREGVSVFRPFWSISRPGTVTIRLYPASHNLSKNEFQMADIPPVICNLRPDQILFVRGSLWMEVSLPRDSYLVWQGYSRRPIGPDFFSPDAPLFMKI